MEYFIYCLKHYCDFSGRARRKEYWMFTLVNGCIALAISILNAVVVAAADSNAILVVSYIYSFALLLPSLAVCVRRLHDIGKSGWSYLIGLIPIVGLIILLVWFCRDGEPNENKWGVNPKSIQ